MNYHNKYAEYMRILKFPQEAAQTFKKTEYRLIEQNVMQNFAQLVHEFMLNNKPYNEIKPLLENMAGQCEVHPYTLLMFFQLNCCQFLEEKYKEKGIDLEIFKNSIFDLTYKLKECHEVYGIWGNATDAWFERFFKLTRFALGRLQFEPVAFRLEKYERHDICVKKGDTVINMHIPSSGPLTEELCMDAYRRAYEFFKEHKIGDKLVFVCHSWLLYPKHREFFPESSNILRFMNDFDIIESYQEEQCTYLWRIFGSSYTLPYDQLPEDTALQRAYKKHLIAGGKGGGGYGVFIFGPNGIIR